MGRDFEPAELLLNCNGWVLLRNPADRSEGIRVFKWPSTLPAVWAGIAPYSYESLQCWHLFLE